MKARQDKLEAEAKSANDSAWWWDKGTKAAEITQTVADKGVDILSTVTGPAGGRIKDVYTVAKGTAEGLGEGIAQGGDYLKNIGKGTAKGVVDLGLGKILDKVNQTDKIPGFKDYNPGVEWGDSRAGFIKDALKGSGVDESVRDIVRDRFKTGAKNVIQGTAQDAAVKSPIMGWFGFS